MTLHIGSWETALGAKCDLEGEVVPQGWTLSPRDEVVPQDGVKIISSAFHYSRVNLPLGVNEGVNLTSRNQSSPLGGKVHPRGKVMLPRTILWPVGVAASMTKWNFYEGEIFMEKMERFVYFKKNTSKSVRRTIGGRFFKATSYLIANQKP
jgi:hypothetical protein